MDEKVSPIQNEESSFICKFSHRSKNLKIIQGMEKSVKSSLNNNTIELPEYIVDPSTKTTYLKGKFLGKMTDLTTNKLYAGKIIPKARLTKTHQREKILREVEVHKLLEHKNVVGFICCFEDKENIYIILENCPRKSLVHVLKNRKVLTEPEVRYYIHQLAEGVEYIHSHGVIHRDLKLGNMFLSENMEVKIGDFGLASHIERAGFRKITVCGTPNYIAPEVLSMEGHGKESDVWAMGCIMYAMLVGHPPFETTTLNETYSRISNNSYCMPMNISESARNLIFSMLKNKPEDRPVVSVILQDQFFHSGYMPKSLPPSCCSSPPKFPTMCLFPRFCLEECDSFNQDLKEITHTVSTLRVHAHSKAGNEKQLTKGVQSSKTEHPKKDGLTSSFKSTLASFLCSEKTIKKKVCTSAYLYNILLSCLENMPKEETGANLPCMTGSTILFITKWIDYSNKYGFGFQLSDNSVGVLFNDTTKIGLSADKLRVEYYDLANKLKTYCSSNVPSILQEKYTLLKYFSQYMEENLTEVNCREWRCLSIQGGEVKHLGLCKTKRSIPYMKRWIRTSRAIIMQLNCGTLQMNFFMDHTKLIVSGGKHHGKLTYINELRHTFTFSIEDISCYGCKSDIICRIQYALSVLREFAELEQDDF
ncbi:serine/threonine-protein kinase PLK1-like isoform X2 [Limulus polyphemus]|uniref:polo kinase n=1 Tax=Limulus polyphemus TaxID=6850 RepID=A0ABM1S8V7_LIMPO|nr:serine/threonine-protein kinase PLK1-like isoform X2 [Limulus polyphemus]